MKRIFDLIVGSLLLFLFIIPMLLIGIFVLMTSNGPSIYWSERVGRRNFIFKMPKFRTMHTKTPDIPSHLLKDPDVFLTPIGNFLRSTSLDELPQLFSILKGDMSLVGPRPALFNQEDLILLRTEKGISQLLPGITGWAQINGRDHLSIKDKVKFDEEYLHKKSFWFDLYILFKTVKRVLISQGISH
jgi:O-antigen biosynthesis protein WbqP